MKLSQVKQLLQKLDTIAFKLPNGTLVPNHFHVTEIGKITKHFIDCGGMERKENVVNFQLWNANDYDHQLQPKKLLSIIERSEKTLHIEDLEIEVEYQAQTIGKYNLDFDGKNFLLINKQTDCLAKDGCGISEEKAKVNLATLNDEPCCSPNGNCC